MSKKRILMIVDVRDWAYDDAAKNWQLLLKNEFHLDILYLEDFPVLRFSHKFNRILKSIQSFKDKTLDLKAILNEKGLFLRNNGEGAEPIFDHKKYDGIYIFYHRALCDSRLLATNIPMNKTAIAINNEKWKEDGVIFTYDNYLKGCKVLTACNNFIIKSFKNIHPNVMKVSQSINPNVFYINRKQTTSMRTGESMVVGWSGNWENKIKNFNIVEKSCKISKVKLRKARGLSRDELNEWYNDIDAIVCASSSEGGPLMLLEAGACAVPVITVPVGLAREIITDGKDGFITNWSPEHISKKINELSFDRQTRARAGKDLQKKILKNWTYEVRLNEIREVFKILCQE